MATSYYYSKSKLKEREISPERTKVWAEPKPKRVPVVYYLSRNGFLEHPHFTEVSLTSHHGLYLKDVISRLNLLRGKGMASLYSWSSKRSYKNGFVWQDLSEDDLIHPVLGHEYVLKGSELVLNLTTTPPRSVSSSSSTSSRFEKSVEISRSDEVRTKKKPMDLSEYKIYRSSDLNADAATQTQEKQKNRRRNVSDEIEIEEAEVEMEMEISPPPSSSSGRSIATVGSSDGSLDRTVGSYSSGRFKASAVLMQLVSCGLVKEDEVVTRGQLDDEVEKCDVVVGLGNNKEYFSGSLVEMKKKGVPALKRSNSFDADRSLKVDLVEKEMEGVHSKCIPRKIKTTAAKKGGSSPSISGSTQGSKRNMDEPCM